MEFLNGIRLGEYGLDPESVIDEINEKCIKGRKNYTAISVRRTDIPDEKFYEWAKYLSDNKIYFHLSWGQYEPSPFSVPAVSEIKRIAGKYFLGIELPELGTIFGCAGKGYKHSPHFHNYERLSEGKEEFVKVVKAARDAYGYPADIGFTFTEATSLLSYLADVGVSMFSLETMCANVDIMTPLIRGAARAAGNLPYMNYIAHEWYGGVYNDDELKKKRLRMVYDHSYMNGASAVIIESGDLSMHSHGMEQGYDGELPTFYRRTVDEFTDFLETDKRPEGLPKVKVAFVQGNLDGWSPWNAGSALWNNINDEAWGYDTPEFTNRILYEIVNKRSWSDVHNFGKEDTSGYVPYDIVNAAYLTEENVNNYDVLIFTGWNTMTDAIYKTLISFVKGGGKLLMCAAHLNESEMRNGEIKLLNNGDLTELFGCRISSDKIVRTNAGVKFNKSMCEDVIYPADMVFDPLLSSGYANYASVSELVGGKNAAILSDSFYENGNGEGAAVMIENKVGAGCAILLTALDYPGKGQTYDVYRTVVRELLSSTARGAEYKILASDKVRYSIYESGDIYLLNTDFDIPSFARVEGNGKTEEVILKPCELKHIKM